MTEQVRHRRPAGRDDDTGLPAEEDDRRDGEYEAERDAACVDALDGDGEPLGEHHAEEERNECSDVCRRMRRSRVGDARRCDGCNPRHDDGGHDRENS